jgi:uncharacterized SAM-binding protein YcdF (DUF218 family)
MPKHQTSLAHAHRILIVTSAYHTRRALAIFRHRLLQYEWSVAAAPDKAAYGTDWLRRRAWAKTSLGEAERFLWWELVDRWRYGPITHHIQCNTMFAHAQVS